MLPLNLWGKYRIVFEYGIFWKILNFNEKIHDKNFRTQPLTLYLAKIKIIHIFTNSQIVHTREDRKR